MLTRPDNPLGWDINGLLAFYIHHIVSCSGVSFSRIPGFCSYCSLIIVEACQISLLAYNEQFPPCYMKSMHIDRQPLFGEIKRSSNPSSRPKRYAATHFVFQLKILYDTPGMKYDHTSEVMIWIWYVANLWLQNGQLGTWCGSHPNKGLGHVGYKEDKWL